MVVRSATVQFIGQALITCSRPASVFVFYSYGDHLDLHSFPTRRSSDLAYTAPPALATTAPPPSAPWTRARKLQDRKSTRLNSSHRCISYAVFCLKKKKSARIFAPTLLDNPSKADFRLPRSMEPTEVRTA